MSERLGFWDYLREAFYRKVPLPLLGRMPANLMALGAFAVLGLANPGFWLLGAAAELVYLMGVGGSGRFQKLVQGEHLLAAQRSWEGELGKAVARLAEEGQERYRHLLRQCRAILGISDTLGGDTLGNLKDLRARNLNQLLTIFLRLLASQHLIQQNVEHVDRGELTRRIAQLEQGLAGAEGNDALKRSLEGTLAIQNKRLENLEKAQTNLRVIEAELLRIEQQVELIREEAAVSGSPRFLSDRLDAVTGALAETHRFLDEHADFLGSLGGEESASAVPALPQLPAELEKG
jgi:hypothetical protein